MKVYSFSSHGWHVASAIGKGIVHHRGKGRKIWQVTYKDLSANVASLDWKNIYVLEHSLLKFVQISISKKNHPNPPC